MNETSNVSEEINVTVIRAQILPAYKHSLNSKTLESTRRCLSNNRTQTLTAGVDIVSQHVIRTIRPDILPRPRRSSSVDRELGISKLGLYSLQ